MTNERRYETSGHDTDIQDGGGRAEGMAGGGGGGGGGLEAEVGLHLPIWKEQTPSYIDIMGTCR